MPSRITSSGLRLATCRFILAVVRGVSEHYLGNEAFGSHADDALLCCAILIGQIERRPMTAAKLAAYVGMARPTVVRKLRALQERGLVLLRDGTASLPIDRVNALTPDIIEEMLSPSFHKLSTELSRMDTKVVARGKNGS